jgi:hypothetical protein
LQLLLKYVPPLNVFLKAVTDLGLVHRSNACFKLSRAMSIRHVRRFSVENNFLCTVYRSWVFDIGTRLPCTSLGPPLTNMRHQHNMTFTSAQIRKDGSRFRCVIDGADLPAFVLACDLGQGRGKHSIMMVVGLHQKVVQWRRNQTVDCFMDGSMKSRLHVSYFTTAF